METVGVESSLSARSLKVTIYGVIGVKFSLLFQNLEDFFSFSGLRIIFATQKCLTSEKAAEGDVVSSAPNLQLDFSDLEASNC